MRFVACLWVVGCCVPLGCLWVVLCCVLLGCLWYVVLWVVCGLWFIVSPGFLWVVVCCILWVVCGMLYAMACLWFVLHPLACMRLALGFVAVRCILWLVYGSRLQHPGVCLWLPSCSLGPLACLPMFPGDAILSQRLGLQTHNSSIYSVRLSYMFLLFSIVKDFCSIFVYV